MSKLLKKVAESVIKQDKNGRNYKTITLETVPAKTQMVPGVGNVNVHVAVKSTSKNVFEQSYLDQKEELGYSLPVGQYVAGDVITRTVEPYEIPNTRPGFENTMRTVTTYSCAVFGDTEDADTFNVLADREVARRHGVGSMVPAGDAGNNNNTGLRDN